MLMSEYSKRSLYPALKGVCKSADCMTKSGVGFVETLRKKEAAQRASKTKTEREEIMTLSDWKKALEKVVNEIVRSVDEKYPCIATGRYTGTMHAGHFRSVNSYPALRFNVWNIHKQCAESNTYKAGDTHLFREGLIARYGVEKMDEIDGLVGRYIVLKINIDEIKYIHLPAAKDVLKRLRKGETFTRDEINELIGIYK
jgi:Bacteriophage Lambda NinG protein